MNNATNKRIRNSSKSGLSKTSHNLEEYLARCAIFLNTGGKELTQVGKVFTYEQMLGMFKLPVKVTTCANKRKITVVNNYITPLNRVLATRGIRIATRNHYTEFYVVAVNSRDIERNKHTANSVEYHAMSMEAGMNLYSGIYQQFTKREFDVMVAQYAAIYNL